MVQSYSPGGANVPSQAPMRAHWHNLVNMTELVLPSVHQSPQPKRQIDHSAVFAQLMAESPYTLQWTPLSPKIASSHGDLAPSNTIPWAHPSLQPNGISIGSAIFAQMTAECPDTLQWDAPFAAQNCPFPLGDPNPI